MILTERHQIKGNEEIERLCNNAKMVYNRCNYLCRKAFVANEKLPNMTELDNDVKNRDFYQNLHNTKTAKQTIRKCMSDWSNFFKALRAFGKDKSKFLGKPKPPGYKNKMAQVIFFNETIKRKPRKSGMIVPTNLLFSIKSEHCSDFKQVVITPKTFGFVIDISFEAPMPPKIKKNKNCCFIDIGVNNLCAMTSDQPVRPVLINGRIAKSINQWFNKNQSKQRSKKRYWRLENYFHHVSRFVIDWCQQNDIATIIIGRNQGWKQGTKIGKRNNQNFQSIPFFKLQKKIQNKADMAGIKVIFTEEAWTSQASFFDNDPIPEFDRSSKPPEMSGTRIKRGLFQTSDGNLLNADVNASLNIGRKVIGEGLISQVDRSVAATPTVVNPLKWFHRETGSMKSGLMAQT